MFPLHICTRVLAVWIALNVVLAFGLLNLFVCLFFFKQKTAYEMRISDWSSAVCSSDLPHHLVQLPDEDLAVADLARAGGLHDRVVIVGQEIGRASCRERVCQYV